MFRPEVRTSFVAVLKSAANRHILTVVATYLLLMAWVASVSVHYGLWSWDQWPNLSIWLLFAGFPIVFSVTEAGKQEDLFRKKAKDAIGLSAFVGFIAEVRSFPLWVEMLLPIVVIVLWFGGYRPGKEHQGRGFYRWALTLVSILVVANSLLWSIGNFSSGWAQEQGMSLLVVMAWTFTTLAFLFFFSIYAVYQFAFLRFNYSGALRILPAWKAKVALIYGIRLDVELAHRFTPNWANGVLQASSFQNALERIEEFTQHMYEEREQQRLHQLKLIHNAGVKGTDEEGRQLDQREFKETIQALDWLHTCHSGHFPRNSRYRQDMVEYLGKGSGFRSLPSDHGIHMEVSDDGQRWFAYRQCAAGWYFGIGGDAPASAGRRFWYYDGPTVPRWPDQERWAAQRGEGNSINWTAN
jgi:hypothetical protein